MRQRVQGAAFAGNGGKPTAEQFATLAAEAAAGARKGGPTLAADERARIELVAVEKTLQNAEDSGRIGAYAFAVARDIAAKAEKRKRTKTRDAETKTVVREDAPRLRGPWASADLSDAQRKRLRGKVAAFVARVAFKLEDVAWGWAHPTRDTAKRNGVVEALLSGELERLAAEAGAAGVLTLPADAANVLGAWMEANLRTGAEGWVESDDTRPPKMRGRAKRGRALVGWPVHREEALTSLARFALTLAGLPTADQARLETTERVAEKRAIDRVLRAWEARDRVEREAASLRGVDVTKSRSSNPCDARTQDTHAGGNPSPDQPSKRARPVGAARRAPERRRSTGVK